MVALGDNFHKLCASHELLEQGTGVRFFVRIEKIIRPAFVIRYSGDPRAYLNECAHQAVELDMLKGIFFDRQNKHIICATHGAMYDPVNGTCISGRCDSRKLRSLTVVEAEKNICFVAEASIEFVSIDNM